MSKGKLIVVSGPSGVGKGTVLKAMMAKKPGMAFSVSATTRAPRPGEEDGKDYYFVTRERFEQMIAEDGFLEYDNHASNYYGTPRQQMEEKRSNGHVLLDIEPNGAMAVKKAEPNAVLVFIMPPSMEELEHRLRGRGDTSEEQIQMRMERAVWEMEQRFWYDHVVLNDDAQRCAAEILELIDGENADHE